MSELSPIGLGLPEPDRFGRSFLIAMAIEVAAIAALGLHAPPPALPATPAVVRLQMLPPAPKPVAKLPPPTTPKPPTPPVPVTPPLPMPPPPPRPTPQRIIRHIPRPVRPPPPVDPTPPMPQLAAIPAAPPQAPVINEDAMTRYAATISAIIQSNLEVPDQLVSEGITGQCMIAFTLAPDGTILSASVISPSGIAAVNDAALAALRASHLPAFLPGMPTGPHKFTLPVRESGSG
ncbi:MAG: TonB family protein [Acidocella sp.]|nr:TonB family protein [Acidocella sp.]